MFEIGNSLREARVRQQLELGEVELATKIRARYLRALEEETFDTLVQLLHPLAPHLTEELWERRGYTESLLETSWPEYDEAKLRRARIELVVQVDGKVRDRVEVDAAAEEKEVRAIVLASPRVKDFLADREVAKAVLVPGRLINLVTRRSA